MAANFQSKHALVRHSREELYMSFTDMRNFLLSVPEDKREGVTADYDHIKATVQGYTIGLKATCREPYGKIIMEDDGAPFKFSVTLHFDLAAEAGCTDFYVEVDADLNLLMRSMLGGKIQEALDKIADSLSNR